MKKILTSGLAALTLAGSIAAAAPASARDWRGFYGYRHDNDAGAAIAGGIVGLALGAALASHNGPGYGPYYGGSYYGGGYYGPAYYGPPSGYGVCVARRTVWDPYARGYVVRPYRYAC